MSRKKLFRLTITLLSLLFLGGCNQRDNNFVGEWILYTGYRIVDGEIRLRIVKLYITDSDRHLYAKDELTDFIWEPLTDAISYRLSSDGGSIYLEDEGAYWFISEDEPNIIYYDEETKLFRLGSAEYETHRTEVMNRGESTLERKLIEESFIGIWNYGFGERGFPLDGTAIEFLTNGTYQLTSSRGFSQITGRWEITSDGYLHIIENNTVAHTIPEDKFTFKIENNQLTLTNHQGEKRSWQREGTWTIDTELDFLGLWEYGYGNNEFSGFEESVGQSGEIEFLPSGYVRITNIGMVQWRFIDDELIIERPEMPTFTVAVDDNMLSITDETGDVRSWIRHGIEPDDYRDWRIREYLDYITIDEGFRLERNFKSATDSFDLISYRMVSLESDIALFNGEVSEYWEIVVLQNGVIQDVIRHYPQTNASWGINRYHPLTIAEVDVDFDGRVDVIIWLGAFGNQGAGRYDAFLQRDNGFIRSNFAEIMNPMINHENQLISASWRGGAAHHGNEFHRFVDGEFIMVAQLERRGWARFLRYNERILVNGEWQESTSCIVNDGEDIDTEYLVQCEIDWNEDLYHRIYDESGYWHLSNRGTWIGEWMQH